MFVQVRRCGSTAQFGPKFWRCLTNDLIWFLFIANPNLVQAAELRWYWYVDATIHPTGRPEHFRAQQHNRYIVKSKTWNFWQTYVKNENWNFSSKIGWGGPAAVNCKFQFLEWRYLSNYCAHKFVTCDELNYLWGQNLTALTLPLSFDFVSVTSFLLMEIYWTMNSLNLTYCSSTLHKKTP